jgi:DNA-binding XRE family transcriptional regulator
MTQAQLAEKAGVCRLSITHLENSGTDHVRISTVIKVCNALGVDLQTLLQ